jgi:hypothetical protein
MNIFSVLSQGKSRLQEPSMSALLGYLLDSNQDHGLSDTFIRAFLTHLDSEVFARILDQRSVNATVELEVEYELNNGRRDIDIEVTVRGTSDSDDFRIIIENKIKRGAASPKQLKEYYEAILQDDPKVRNLYIVFLTPEINASALNAEFANLTLKNNRQHFKKRIYWDSGKQGGVLPMLRQILMQEAIGEITPINEYMRHTIKAFIRHASVVTQPNLMRGMRTGEDIGEITDETTISMKDGRTYRVVRRDSTQIQVFNEETGDKEIARRILAEFIDENLLKIPHRQLNTRGIGKQFFEWNKELSSVMVSIK